MDRKGFTLIETLIYVAIVSTVVAGFIAFALSIAESRNSSFVVQEVQANARMAMKKISQKVRLAESIMIASTTWGTDPGVLYLQMSSSTVNPTIISLTADNGQLQIREGASANQVLTSSEVKISNLVFTNYSSSTSRGNIQINLTAEYNGTGSSRSYIYSYSLQTAVSLRK